MNRIRRLLEGRLLERDAKKFIENDGSKRYRISKHQDFVTYACDNLFRHTDPAVGNLLRNTQGCGDARK